MIKTRFFIFLLCGVLIFSCFAFSSGSASAAEEDVTDCINVLDYDFPDDYTSVRSYMTQEQPYNFFDLPFSYGVVFFDVIVEVGSAPSSAGIRSPSGTVLDLTLVSLGDNRYRCYGSSSQLFNSSSIGFQLVVNTSRYTVTYQKFDIYTLVNVGTGDLGEMNILPNADTSVSTNYWYRQSAPGVSIVQDFYYFSSSVQFFDYQVRFSSVNWRKYDYLDFTFQINASSVECISAYIDSGGLFRYLPFEISYLNAGVIDKNEYIGSGTTTVIPGSSQWNVVMRVFIPASYRLSGSLYIDVGGQYHNPPSRAILQSVTGYYYTSVPSPDLVKLDQIAAAIKESLSSSAEDNAVAEDFAQNMTSQKEQMAANQAQINNVDKPSADDLGSIAAPNLILNNTGMGYLTSIIQPITTGRAVLSMLTLSATLALVSYVFFGKKG